MLRLGIQLSQQQLVLIQDGQHHGTQLGEQTVLQRQYIIQHGPLVKVRRNQLQNLRRRHGARLD